MAKRHPAKKMLRLEKNLLYFLFFPLNQRSLILNYEAIMITIQVGISASIPSKSLGYSDLSGTEAL